MLLSVIVPIYNEEKYLERCIKSLLQINVSKYEILLVDDGSSDKSVDICNAYALRYDFIHAFHKENGGIISARKYGVKNARGKYIAFVDGDDWVGEKIFTDFISQMEKDDTLDICIGGLRKIFSDGLEYTICQPSSSQFMNSLSAMKEMLQWTKFRWELCGNVYRKELFIDFNPPNDIRIGEDLVSNFILLCYARRVFYAPVYQYYYFTNINSETQSDTCKLESLLKPFYIIDNLKMQDKDINIRVKEFYVKEIVKDILYRFFFNDDFVENIPFYRKELKKLLKIPSIQQFIRQHFNEKNLLESLTDDMTFSAFWKTVFSNLVSELAYNANCYKNIYIYGTGIISRFVTEILKKYNINYNSYVVSDGQWKKDKSIIYLSELNNDNQDTIFILALSQIYHNEVIKNLGNKGYTHYFAPNIITDMYR